MSKILTWFGTKNGRRFTATCIGVACFSTLGLRFILHGPYQDNVREMVQLYKRGKPKPVSDEVQKIVKEDLYHLGGTNSPWGALIGLPFYFEAPEELDFAALRLRGQDSVDWIIDGQDLITALTISEKAKKFAIMREIYSSDIWDKLDNALILPVCIAFSALFARRLNTWRNAFSKSFKSRLATYAMSYITGIYLYRLLKDPLKHISDKKYDELAALTGPDYLEGGIEFYEHMLMKNKALRELLGKKGESLYDANGNENYFIFVPKLPTNKRLELLKKLKEDNVKEIVKKLKEDDVKGS